MPIKNVIIDDIYYINFITFDISNLLFSWFALLELGCVLYTHAPYMPSNMVIHENFVNWKCDKNNDQWIKTDLVRMIIFGVDAVNVGHFKILKSIY